MLYKTQLWSASLVKRLKLVCSPRLFLLKKMKLVTFFTNLLPVVSSSLPISFASPTTAQLGLDVISGTPHNGPSTVQFLSTIDAFDGPKVQNLNNTVFDLWYFDVMSSDLQSSVVLVFFTATPTGLFPGLPDLGTATWMLAEITFPDGSAFETVIAADQLIVVTAGNGSSGSLKGTRAGWQGASDLSSYVVTIDAPDLGLQGTVTLDSVCPASSKVFFFLPMFHSFFFLFSFSVFPKVAPAHFPCSACSDKSGQSYRLTPNLGWFNAVPDATGKVDLTANGTKAQFSGPGYHDKVRNFSRPIHSL